MDLSISVANWNTSKLLARCLRAVAEHSGNLEYELTVVDNASTDADVRALARSFPDVQWVFRDDNSGALAINAAWNRIRGRYFLFLGPDAQVQPGCLPEMVGFLDAHPQAGAVSGLLLDPDGSIQHYYRRLPTLAHVFFCWTRLGITLDRRWLSRQFFHDYRCAGLGLDSVVEIQQPPAACLLMRSELARAKPGFIIDPKFPFYFNDVDLCKRVYRAGYRIYVLPRAKVIHDLGSSFSRRDEEWKQGENYASLFRYLFKHHPAWAGAVYVYAVCETLVSLGLNVTRGAWSPGHEQSKAKVREASRMLSRLLTFFAQRG